MFNYLKKHNMRNSLKTLLCLTVICVFSNNAAARICFLPDGDCGKTKINVNSGKNGCIYKTKGEADAGKNDECEVSYQSQVNSCWWRRCNSDNKTIFDKLADCQKKIEDATSQKCQACGSCYKLVTIPIPPNACPDGYSTKYQSQNDCPDGKTFSENGTYNGLVCGACIPAKTCPSGYSTQYQSKIDCQSGETFSSSGSVGNLICGKCVSATCTDVAANENKLEEIHQYETISATKTENVVDANLICGTEKVANVTVAILPVSGSSYDSKTYAINGNMDSPDYNMTTYYYKTGSKWYVLSGSPSQCYENVLCGALVGEGYNQHISFTQRVFAVGNPNPNSVTNYYCCKSGTFSEQAVSVDESPIVNKLNQSCKTRPNPSPKVANFQPTKVCDKGTIGSDGKCHLGTYSYSCPSGYTLNGEKCVSQTMSCPTGYTASAKDATSYYCRKTEYTCPTTFSYTLSGSKCVCENTEDIISITALSCSLIDENPSYRDIQTFYSFIYSPNQQQSLNAYVFTKDLISGETDDNEIGIHTAGDIDEYIDNLTYSSGCPNSAIDTFSRYYKEDYEDNGESYKAGEYSRRENIADVKFFIGEDSSNLINTQQKVPFPFYDIDNTPTKSAEFTYNNQKYVITAVKKEVSNTNTCDDGYSSEKPSDNIFYYTQKGNCYKATGCIENGIVSATSATGCVGTPQCVTPDKITHTAQTCYINWPSDIEFFLAWDKIAEYTGSGQYQWVIGNGYASEDKQTAGYWKRVKGVYDSLYEPSSRYYKIKTEDVKKFFYLKKINVYDKEMLSQSAVPVFAAYWRISPTNSCQSGSLVHISHPDSIEDFGDQNQILPVIHPMTGDKWNSYTSSNDTGATGFCTENENSLSQYIYLEGSQKTILYDYTKHDVTVCFKYYQDDNQKDELCKDIQMRMYINR